MDANMTESGETEKPQFDRARAVKLALRHHIEHRTSRAEAALEWFHTEGVCLFERSAAGGQIEAMKLASAARVECPVCCSVERRIDSDCMAERLHLIDPEAAVRRFLTPGILPGGQECQRCKGTGVVEIPIPQTSDRQCTARPTGHEVRDHGYQVDSALMTRYAQVTRWLDNVGRLHSEVLKAYYGPDATRCAMVNPWGMHLAVMPQCAAGKDLLRRGGSRVELRLHPIEQIRVQAIVQTQDPKPWRGELLERGYEQVSGMLRDALEAFTGEMGR